MKYERYDDANGTIRFVPDGAAPNPPSPPVPPPPPPPAVGGTPVTRRFDFGVDPTNDKVITVATPLGSCSATQVTLTHAAVGKQFPAQLSYAQSGGPGNRKVTLSRTAGDFSESAIWVSSKQGDNGGSANFTIGAPGAMYPSLGIGLWYINVQNMDTLVDTVLWFQN